VPSNSASGIGSLLVDCSGGTAAAAEETVSDTAVDANIDAGVLRGDFA
jgi:hypothetical protein